MTWLGFRSRLAWAICGLTIAAAVAVVVLTIADPNSAGPNQTSRSGPTADDTPARGYLPYAVLTGFVFSTFGVVGAVVAARRPRNAFGWLIDVGALLWMLAVLSNGVYWSMAFGRPHAPAASDFVAWFGSWAFVPAFVLVVSLVPLLFPTGAPPSPRWRVVGWTAAIAGVIATLSTAFAPGSLETATTPGWTIRSASKVSASERLPMGRWSCQPLRRWPRSFRSWCAIAAPAESSGSS